jgi:ABC-type glycerol-3-phosphate transport system permease component
MNETLQDLIEAFHEKCDLWQWLMRTMTALTVSLAIVFGACAGFALAGKIWPVKVAEKAVGK